MKIVVVTIVFCLCFFANNSQIVLEKLVYSEDLCFHSDFEKVALQNFIINKTDTFNLFLAIDENMDIHKAKQYRSVYDNMLAEIVSGNLEKKKLEKKVKKIYHSTHSYFLRKYNDVEYFPDIFSNGSYNCVSASILYSLVFEETAVPYAIQASTNHVYIVANPGENSIVIETTNPVLEKAIFTGEFKRQYVSYLKDQKLISEYEYKNKSTEELFEMKYNEVKEADFNYLPGFQYYNKAIEKILNHNYEEALELCKKAYFFYPNDQVKLLFYNLLVKQISRSEFDQKEDIDLLLYISRFNNTDPEMIGSIFLTILEDKFQYLGTEDICTEMYERFVQKCKDRKVLNEVGFTYNLYMYRQNKRSANAKEYLIEALKIKDNHKYARKQFDYFLYQHFSRIMNPQEMRDSIDSFEKRYSYDFVKSSLLSIRLISFLRSAKQNFESGNITAADSFLLKFEKDCQLPVENSSLQLEIVSAYRSGALVYYYKNNKDKMRVYLDRGLKYVPDSELLRSSYY